MPVSKWHFTLTLPWSWGKKWESCFFEAPQSEQLSEQSCSVPMMYSLTAKPQLWSGAIYNREVYDALEKRGAWVGQPGPDTFGLMAGLGGRLWGGLMKKDMKRWWIPDFTRSFTLTIWIYLTDDSYILCYSLITYHNLSPSPCQSPFFDALVHATYLGGAVWERFESAKKAVDRNMGSHIFGKEDAKEETKPIGSIGQPPTDTFPKTPPKTPTGTPPKTPTETPRKTPETPAGTATDKALEERKEDAKGISKTPTATPPKTPTETPRKTPETPAGTATDKALEALEERKEDAKGISKTPTGTPPKTPTEMPRKTPETPTGTATDKALEALEERKEDAKGSSKTVPRTPPGTPPKTPTETPRKLPPTRTVTELVPEEIEEDFEEDPSSPINIPAKTHPKTPTETPTRKTPKTPTEKVLEKQENAKEETSKDATRQWAEGCWQHCNRFPG